MDLQKHFRLNGDTGELVIGLDEAEEEEFEDDDEDYDEDEESIELLVYLYLSALHDQLLKISNQSVNVNKDWNEQDNKIDHNISILNQTLTKIKINYTEFEERSFEIFNQIIKLSENTLSHFEIKDITFQSGKSSIMSKYKISPKLQHVFNKHKDEIIASEQPSGSYRGMIRRGNPLVDIFNEIMQSLETMKYLNIFIVPSYIYALGSNYPRDIYGHFTSDTFQNVEQFILDINNYDDGSGCMWQLRYPHYKVVDSLYQWIKKHKKLKFVTLCAETKWDTEKSSKVTLIDRFIEGMNENNILCQQLNQFKFRGNNQFKFFCKNIEKFFGKLMNLNHLELSFCDEHFIQIMKMINNSEYICDTIHRLIFCGGLYSSIDSAKKNIGSLNDVSDVINKCKNLEIFNCAELNETIMDIDKLLIAMCNRPMLHRVSLSYLSPSKQSINELKNMFNVGYKYWRFCYLRFCEKIECDVSDIKELIDAVTNNELLHQKYSQTVQSVLYDCIGKEYSNDVINIIMDFMFAVNNKNETWIGLAKYEWHKEEIRLLLQNYADTKCEEMRKSMKLTTTLKIQIAM